MSAPIPFGWPIVGESGDASGPTPPLVSVVMANYNYAHFIHEAIASVAAQTYARLEVIVVDDGSGDGSRGEIEDAARRHDGRFERFETLYLPRNGGKQAALNQALPRVRGDITVIFDADDVLEPHYLEVTVGMLLERHRADPSVQFVYTDSVLVDESGATLAYGHSTAFCERLVESRSYIPECAPTFTPVVLGVLPLDERVRVGTKHERWRRIVRGGAAGYHVPRPLLRYRMHGANLSGIGARIEGEIAGGSRSAFILSGIWPTAPHPEGADTASVPAGAGAAHPYGS